MEIYMFGYIKPDSYAPKKYKEYFRKNYCFLCRALDKHYGFFSRLFVSFDVTFFAILFSKDNYLADIGKVGCLKSDKKLKERLNDEFAEKIAALNLALVAGELVDNIGDKDKFYTGIAYFCYGGVFKKVQKRHPLLWEIIETGHEKMREIEERNGTVEEMEETFATLIERITREFFSITDESKISYIRYVAKMLYFMDAVDDINKDIRRNSFNGLKKYGNKSDYVLRNYSSLKEHLENMRSDIIRYEAPTLNAATVNRIMDIGIPEMLLKVCFNDVRLEDRATMERA
jgi:hypothetical protein